MNNELKLTVGKAILIKHKIPTNLVGEYEIERKEFGEEIATNNLLISLTKELVNAKRIKLQYNK